MKAMARSRFFFLVVLAAPLILLAGCPADTGGSAYVSFAANGNPVTLVHGDIPWLVDEYVFAYGGIDGVKTLIHVEASEENNNNHYLRFYFPGTTEGTYSGAEVDVEYTTDYANDERYDNQDFTVIVSRMGAVDGFMEGSFSGTVHDTDLGTITITNGSFRVVRVE
jgi:hypothetical protein